MEKLKNILTSINQALRNFIASIFMNLVFRFDLRISWLMKEMEKELHKEKPSTSLIKYNTEEIRQYVFRRYGIIMADFQYTGKFKEVMEDV